VLAVETFVSQVFRAHAAAARADRRGAIGKKIPPGACVLADNVAYTLPRTGS
jgi:hypothetical protein